MVNKVVVRFANEKIRKGTTEDFFPNKDIFHMRDKETGEVQTIDVHDL